MADRAARWVDTLLPRVAVRQVVVTVPWPRRWATEDVEGLVVRIADRAEAWLARQGFGRAGDGRGERGEEDALLAIQSAPVTTRWFPRSLGYQLGKSTAEVSYTRM